MADHTDNPTGGSRERRDGRSSTCRRRIRPGAPSVLSAATVAALLLLLVGAAPAFASIWDSFVDPVWTSYENGAGNDDDWATDVALGSGGATYVAGTVTNAVGKRDISLAKYVEGSIAWSGVKTYDGPAHEGDTAECVALAPGGFVYVAGASDRADGTCDLVLVKWSAKTGKRIWVRRYDGPAHDRDSASAVVVDRWGNVTVAGYSHSSHGMDVYVRSYTSSGRVRWSWRYGGSAHLDDWASDLAVARDGSVYVTGQVVQEPNLDTALTVRFSRSGAKKWLRLYTGPERLGADVHAMTARPGGGVYVAGSALTSGSQHDGLVVAYTATGAYYAFALESGPDNQRFSDVAVASTGDVAAVGQSRASGQVKPRWVIYSAAGIPVSASSIATLGADALVAAAADAYGGYYFTGTSTLGSGDVQIETRRYSCVPGGGGWASAMLPYATGLNRPLAIAVRGTTVVVVGQVNTGGAAKIDQFVWTYIY